MPVQQNTGSSERKNLMSLMTSDEFNNPHLFELKEFQKNEYIYLPEEISNCIYIIKKGRVKTGSQFDYDKKFIKDILNQGDFFGEFSLFSSSNKFGFAKTMEDTTILLIPCEAFKILMMKFPDLNFFVLQVLGQRIIETEQRIESLMFNNSRSRIIGFIKNFVIKYGKKVGYEVVIWKVLTHQEIANFTDTSRQTVTTVLNELRNKNILTFNRRRLLIRDMDLLNAEAA